MWILSDENWEKGVVYIGMLDRSWLVGFTLHGSMTWQDEFSFWREIFKSRVLCFQYVGCLRVWEDNFNLGQSYDCLNLGRGERLIRSSFPNLFYLDLDSNKNKIKYYVYCSVRVLVILPHYNLLFKPDLFTYIDQFKD